MPKTIIKVVVLVLHLPDWGLYTGSKEFFPGEGARMGSDELGCSWRQITEPGGFKYLWMGKEAPQKGWSPTESIYIAWSQWSGCLTLVSEDNGNLQPFLPAAETGFPSWEGPNQSQCKRIYTNPSPSGILRPMWTPLGWTSWLKEEMAVMTMDMDQRAPLLLSAKIRTTREVDPLILLRLQS